VGFAMSGELAPNGRAKRYEVVRCFAQYHAAFDPRTESLDLRATTSISCHCSAEDSE